MDSHDGNDKGADAEELFRRLVENALDFLGRAVEDLDQSPKYSVIHFNGAVELFLKARLMHEHWSLVVSKRTEPDWEKFVAGDFQSVSLDEAASRLEKIVGSGLTMHELRMFREVARHRNKIMHFFHEAHSEEAEEEQKRTVAKQQLSAWYFLHQLLRDRWADVFLPWSEEIAKIDRALKKQRDFLQISFDQLGSRLEEYRRNGATVAACPSCTFEAQVHVREVDQIYEAECLVCDVTEGCIDIECVDCNSVVEFRGDGFATCECGKEYEPADLADIVEDEVAAHIAVKDGDDSWERGNCSDCDGFETLVRPRDSDESYVCVSCLQRFDHVERCEWCNAPNNGDMEGSYYSGCIVCDGKAGNERDD